MNANAYKQPYERLYDGSLKNTHIKSMVTLACKHYGKPNPEIDAYRSTANAQWLEANLSGTQINTIHYALIDEYKKSGDKAFKRGRPPGAKNRPKFNSADPNSFDPIASDEPGHAQEMPTEEIRTDLQSTKIDTPQQIDHILTEAMLNKYVKKEEFENCTNTLRAVIETECKDSFARDAGLRLEIRALAQNRPTIVEIKRQELPTIQAGIQHKNFPRLLRAAYSRQFSGHHHNIWLFGPAGTGKTTAAEKLAEIMFGDDYKLHTDNKATREAFTAQFKQDWEGYNYNGALATQFQLTGYNDANGRYVYTAFRKAWEFGGVYLFDEIDGSMPDALLAMNGALANGVASFPDRMVKRHKDCLIIAGANTTGLGGGTEYVGAMKQNAAFLNRFVFVPWPHDNALEDVLAGNSDWVQRVRQIRERMVKQGNKSQLITMRASLFGAAMLASGIPQNEVEEATLKQGMSDAQWDAIKY